MNKYLEQMKNYLRPWEYWDNWLKKSGELPPDFDNMPSVHGLPDPFDFMGSRISKSAEWPAQRKKILEVFKRYIIGTYPEAPKTLKARVIKKETGTDGTVKKEIELVFGPGNSAKMHFEILIPKVKGSAKLPVFITQRGHYAWSRIALSRGYIAVSYNGSDIADDTQAYKEIWPKHDWTRLTRRAWGAGRVLDWIHANICAADKKETCITGHSRNGKLSLICGAIDERFTAVISSSSGVGGATPYRYANDSQFAEGMEVITSRPHNQEWFHQRARFFAGREDKLPVDSNLLIALSAPRAVLVSSAMNDSCESIKAAEIAVNSASKVFKLLKKPENLKMLVRYGEHDTRPEEIERYMDWCDLYFGRFNKEKAAAAEIFFEGKKFFPYTWESWKKKSKISINPLKLNLKGGGLKERIGFLLGEPPFNSVTKINDYGLETNYKSTLFGRAKNDGLFRRCTFNFGNYIAGNVYLPKKISGLGSEARYPYGSPKLNIEKMAEKYRGKKLPLLIWLSADSISDGYSGAYMVIGKRMPEPLVRHGFPVIAYDHIGNGNRVEEAGRFYERYPRWSLLGKMVYDTKCAVDAAMQMNFVDKNKIFLYGFGMGGMAAIFSAALDKRVAGAASIAGFSPLKGNKEFGINEYALRDSIGLIPKLGFFKGSPEKIPVDFDEILSSIAPRKLFLVTPVLDREADYRGILRTIEKVKNAYNKKKAGKNLWHYAPMYHRSYTLDMNDRTCAAIKKAAGI